MQVLESYHGSAASSATIRPMEDSQIPDFKPLMPRVVLGIAAHPDDLDFGAGGTLAKYAQAGAAVHYLILTDGSKGSENKSVTSEELTKIRHAEQEAAAEIIGDPHVTFLDYPDGGLEITMELKQAIVKVIRTVKPDVVITLDPATLYSPGRGFINHPDHRAAGQAALDAVFPLARDHLSFPELYAAGYEPHKVKTVLLTNFDKGNYSIDISAAMPTKLDMLKAHASQISDLDSTKQWVESMASQLGKAHDYDYAESFVRLDVPE